MALLKYSFGLIMLALCAVGCKNVSKHLIDQTPITKIDSNLLGSWKVEEDTDKANYFIVEPATYYYGASHPPVRADLPEYSTFSFLYPAYCYMITYMNHHGKNPQFQHCRVFPSVVGNYTFLNIGYHNVYRRQDDDAGYLLMRIDRINNTYDTIVASMVADTTMRSLWNAQQVRHHVTVNLNNPSFYDKPLHLYRVK